MGTELATVKTPGTLSDKMAYAKALAAADMLPKQYRDYPANLLWAMELAAALQIAPMAAITGIHSIDGRPTASAGLISALVRRAGHRLRVTGDGEHAVCEIVRCDDPDFVFRSTWTMDRARAAQLTGKDVWKKYPAAMLKARAITEAARDACQEALSGVQYTPEEMDAQVNEEGEPIDVTPHKPPVDTAADLAEFCGALTAELSLDIADVAAFQTAVKQARPDVMTPAQRQDLFRYLKSDEGKARYQAYLVYRDRQWCKANLAAMAFPPESETVDTMSIADLTVLVSDIHAELKRDKAA